MPTDEEVSQFMAVTGSADPEQATNYLEMSGGDLETAVGLYMEHNMGGGGASAGGMGGMDAGSGDAQMAAAMASQQDVRAPDATRTMRLMDDVMDVGHHPALGNPGLAIMNAMMDEQLAQSAFASPPSRLNARDVVNSAAANENKRGDSDEEEESGDGDDEEYEYDDDDDGIGNAAPPAPARLSDMFSPPEHLMHTAGGFQGARSMAKDSKRWLLVNLQRDSEFASHALNRDVWRDELVENLVREGFIFWQAMDISSEGRTYSERYAVHDYPHLAILDPRTGRLLWRKEGWTQEKPLTAETFAEYAMDFCSRNSFDKPPSARPPTSNGAVRPPVKRSMQEMSEDEQMKAAVNASLEKESGSQDEEMEDRNDDDNDEADAKPAAVEDAPPEEEKAGPSLLEDLKSVEVGDEPAKGARLQLRLPDGKRKVRKFAPSDTIKIIYAFLAQETQGDSAGREFTLMVGFPPRDLLPDMDNTIESCKLAGEAITMRWK
ncbi:UBX domain-containing protein 7 [Seminavis robusta]|uniref:UBX domain-containing protein 7 n=1 Tax=Seminavis robusta TaxID=568900 RepID=A0A9N8DNF3_9STRA|nr:UBX domain-containing protein 7 [Seminavis robusta]|eukprot:Sro245_g097330.1 UBX domain-containing protein 7 (491) ;mRNA; r:24479-26310